MDSQPWHRITTWLMPLPVLTIVLLLPCLARTQPHTLDDPAHFIPPGARIGDPARHVMFEDLDGDGAAEAVIFYRRVHGSQRSAGLVVLARSGEGYQQIWSHEVEHSLGLIGRSGVKHLTGANTPQIVAFWGIGASCQGSLDIFQYRLGRFESIAGAWKSTGCQNDPRFGDLDSDGVPEVIFKVHRNTAVPHIYRWASEGYVLDRERYPDYFQDGLKQMRAAALGQGTFPATARVTWGLEAVEILLIQQRHGDAIEFGKELLIVLDDPQRSTANSIEASLESREFQNDISRTKAKLYRQMSRIATIAGDLVEAAEFQWQAEQIESRASN